jgi:hypothetical protein
MDDAVLAQPAAAHQIAGSYGRPLDRRECSRPAAPEPAGTAVALSLFILGIVSVSLIRLSGIA